MKGGNQSDPAAVWPRVQSGAVYVRASATSLESPPDAVIDDDDSNAAPTYKQSFSADFGHVFQKFAIHDSSNSSSSNTCKCHLFML